MKQVAFIVALALFALFVTNTYAWPNQIGACGSPIYYDSFNATPNAHTSEFPSNGSWVLNGVPTTWFPNTQYLITINGSQAGINGTRNSRVRGFLLAAFDSNKVAYGTWSDSLGYAQPETCGQNYVQATPNPTYGTPGFQVNAGTVGSHTSLIGTTYKIYQFLNVTWTSPPVAVNLTFGGVIVSDKIYNSLLPLYPTFGIQGTSPIPTITTAATTASNTTAAGTSATAAAGTSATAAAGTSATAAAGTSAGTSATNSTGSSATPSTSIHASASSLAVSFALSALIAILLL
jgi:hypothetical protein